MELAICAALVCLAAIIKVILWLCEEEPGDEWHP